MIKSSDVRLAAIGLMVVIVGAACDPATASPAASVAATASTPPAASAPSAGTSSAVPSIAATPRPSVATVTPSASAALGWDDWSYSGATGPEHWAELSDNYYACKYGVTQSPIDISGPDEMAGPDPVFHYHAGPGRVVNDGHTVLAIPDGKDTLEVRTNDTTWKLLEVRFHVPSEHVIAGGAPFPAEVQFVHQHVTGMFTVVGAMVEEGADDNSAWAPYIDAMTTPVGVEGVPVTIDWPNLLPPYVAAYFYDGSLTTPPCTERVEWIFLTDPVKLSAAQIGKMRAAYPDSARPLQTYGLYRSLTYDEPGL